MWLSYVDDLKSRRVFCCSVYNKEESTDTFKLPTLLFCLLSFVIVLSFRANSPNGVLLYAANAMSRHFMALIMINGMLSFNIMTDSRAMTGLNINTNQRYDNGLWQEVRRTDYSSDKILDNFLA